MRWRGLLFKSCVAALLAATATLASNRRPPIMIVPGAPGTELVDSATGEIVFPNVWLMSIKNGTDQLALPLDDPERTSVVAGGLLRSVRVVGLKFPVRAYNGLEKKLKSLGYRPGDWNAPTAAAEYFYFPYDWRQSFETTGRRFARELDAFYRRSPPGTPPAIVLGHSLGGLVARYALMYGEVPLGAAGPMPAVSWAGSAHIGTLFLVATPNEGTFLALKRLEKGIYYRNHRGAFSAETLFSYPSVFDMIPAHLQPLVDAAGQPLPFGLDNPNDWERIGWSVVDPRKKSTIPYAARRAHLEQELTRTRRLWSAMSQLGSTPNPVPIYVVAGLAGSVQRTALVTQKHGGVKVKFAPPAASGTRFKALLFEPGDEMVPVRSLVAEESTHDPASSLCFAQVLGSKRSHHNLLSSPELLAALAGLLK